MTAVETPPRAWIAEQLDELHVHGAVALEGADPEGVHQLRVAVRRIRAVLKASRFDDGGTLFAELRWFFGELGPLRDLDVLLDRFRGDTDGFGREEMIAFERLLKGLRAERGVARRRATRTLRGERYGKLLRTLAETNVAPRAESGLVAEIVKPFHKLRKAVRAAGQDPEDEVLHELRIRGKKLRYVAELAAPAGGKRVKRLVKATKRLQDVLGEHQDACVAEDRVRSLVADGRERAAGVWTERAAEAVSEANRRAAQGGKTSGTGPRTPSGARQIGTEEAFVAGRLVERERNRQAAAREQWYPAYQEVERCAVELLG
jgi:CHAD domain-containing protein